MRPTYAPDASDIITHLQDAETVLIEHCSWSQQARSFTQQAFAFEAELARALQAAPADRELIRVVPYDAPPGLSPGDLHAFDEWLDVVTITSQLATHLRILVFHCTDMTMRPKDLLFSGDSAVERRRQLDHSLYPRQTPDWTDDDLKDVDPFWILDMT